MRRTTGHVGLGYTPVPRVPSSFGWPGRNAESGDEVVPMSHASEG